MTHYKTTFDRDAWDYTGLGYKVSCYEDDIFLWHRYCRDEAEVDSVTGDICSCGCADYDEHNNHAGAWRKCVKCWLVRGK